MVGTVYTTVPPPAARAVPSRVYVSGTIEPPVARCFTSDPPTQRKGRKSLPSRQLGSRAGIALRLAIPPDRGSCISPVMRPYGIGESSSFTACPRTDAAPFATCNHPRSDGHCNNASLFETVPVSLHADAPTQRSIPSAPPRLGAPRPQQVNKTPSHRDHQLTRPTIILENS